jgi:hypothetical protein
MKCARCKLPTTFPIHDHCPCCWEDIGTEGRNEVVTRARGVLRAWRRDAAACSAAHPRAEAMTAPDHPIASVEEAREKALEVWRPAVARQYIPAADWFRAGFDAGRASAEAELAEARGEVERLRARYDGAIEARDANHAANEYWKPADGFVDGEMALREQVRSALEAIQYRSDKRSYWNAIACAHELLPMLTKLFDKMLKTTKEIP